MQLLGQRQKHADLAELDRFPHQVARLHAALRHRPLIRRHPARRIERVRALLVDSDSPARLRLGDAPDPTPGCGQALIEVSHSSLNAAESFFATTSEPGTVLGFDAAGIVVAAAADGSGPPVGTRVVSFAAGGGWAELRAVWQAGPTAGRRVLVTGASGGVGSFAVQLAAIGGAHVIASVGSPERREGLAELGATEVVVGLDGISDPLDIVIDQVGGPQMAGAYGLLAPGGTLQSIGWASGQPATFPPGSSLGSPAPKSIVSVYNGAGLTDRRRQLTALLDLLAGGRLTVAIGWRGPWHRIADAVEALTARRLSGKAILDITQ